MIHIKQNIMKYLDYNWIHQHYEYLGLIGSDMISSKRTHLDGYLQQNREGSIDFVFKERKNSLALKITNHDIT